VVSIFAFTRIMQAFGASSTAMLTAASPVVVALLAIVFLGEIPTALGWAGLVSVVLGIIATMLVLETRPA
jgi:drug/metabolite transporter (DMT)-like permease